MRAGDRVELYEDPQTRQKLEGRATVVRVLWSRDGMWDAEVRFDNEPCRDKDGNAVTYQRIVKDMDRIRRKKGDCDDDSATNQNQD